MTRNNQNKPGSWIRFGRRWPSPTRLLLLMLLSEHTRQTDRQTESEQANLDFVCRTGGGTTSQIRNISDLSCFLTRDNDDNDDDAMLNSWIADTNWNPQYFSERWPTNPNQQHTIQAICAASRHNYKQKLSRLCMYECASRLIQVSEKSLSRGRDKRLGEQEITLLGQRRGGSRDRSRYATTRDLNETHLCAWLIWRQLREEERGHDGG